MRKILEDFMAMVIASEEENPSFTTSEILAFYGMLVFFGLLLLGSVTIHN